MEHVLIGPRLLDKSRRALARVYTLALLWRLDGKQPYFDRAVRELDAVCRFPDWNPAHFLDTAEMTHMVAIGYDWLYPSLTADQRQRYRHALVTLGLDPGLAVYRGKGWWVKSEFNWNQVCNGGMTIGALAVAEDEPERSREVLDAAVKSLPLALTSYAPDGGWAEGPGYWDYATRYNRVHDGRAGIRHRQRSRTVEGARLRPGRPLPRLLVERHRAELQLRRRGFARVALLFDVLARAALPQSGVCLAGATVAPEGASGRVGTWCGTRRKPRSPAEAGWPLAATFTGINVAFARSSWESPDAAFFAIKGGDNKANHSHLDLGTFVFDAAGERYAIDLGGDDYDPARVFRQAPLDVLPPAQRIAQHGVDRRRKPEPRCQSEDPRQHRGPDRSLRRPPELLDPNVRARQDAPRSPTASTRSVRSTCCGAW